MFGKRRTARAANRQGITLLMVISLITLFLLMGASFVLLANQFRRSATLLGRMDVRRDDARSLVSRAFYDLLREPSLDDTRNPLRCNSLLGDMYGYGGVAFVRAASANPASLGQVVELQLTGNSDITITANHDQVQSILQGGTAQNLADHSGAYDGLVLSFTTGMANGTSCRILASIVEPNGSGGFNKRFLIVPIWNDQVVAFANPALLVGSRVVINGRPFSGTGAGAYHPLTPIDQPALSLEALRPNRVSESRAALIAANGYLGLTGVSTGNPQSANEDYDAKDYQNMFLAAKLPNGTILPSFADQALERFTSSNPGSVFRAFNKNNPMATPEVDNDFDGVPDGFWMDLNYPVMTDMKGKVYKALVSYHVLDMDSRINVNAHGNASQIPSNSQFKNRLNLLESFYGSASYGQAFSTGQGLGTAEINPTLAGLPLQTLLTGNGTYSGRYGVDGVPGLPGRDNASAYKLFGYPQRNFAAQGLVGNSFSSPMDIFGRLGYGTSNLWAAPLYVDPYFPTALPAHIPIGMPITDMLSSPLVDEIADSPYEADFSASPFDNVSGADTPFTARELEGLLRANDGDTNMLPRRLRDIINAGNRDLVTTDSFEVPVPRRHLVDVLASMFLNDTTWVANLSSPTPAEIQAINTQIAIMLPPEVRHGQRMDLNRVFGNGLDDNGNGIVDEPTEAMAGENFADPYGRVISMDTNNDGIAGGFAESMTRQIFARHLYMVILLTTQWVDRNGNGNVNNNDWDDWYDYDKSGTTDDADLKAYRRDVAQWVANVVDFRDADSIMTPFEFDLNPRDGWGVDGNIATDEGIPDRYVVWGAEKPDLLLTEAWGVHMRRTTDSDMDAGVGDDVAGGDPDRDSQYVPSTGAYFELLACRTSGVDAIPNANNQIFPAEIYGSTGVDLARTTPTGGSPVWRLSVRKRYKGDSTPDDTTDDQDDLGNPDPNVFSRKEIRRVYFVRPNASVEVAAHPKVFFPTVTVPELAVGANCVVGGGIRNGGDYTTYLGRRNTPTWDSELDDTRSITLRPAANQIEFRFYDEANARWQQQLRSAVVVPVLQVDDHFPGGYRPFGITDPVNGYGRGDGRTAATSAATGIGIRAIADGYEYFDVATGTVHIFDKPTDFQLNPNDWSDVYETALPVASLDSPAMQTAGIRDDGLHRKYSAVFLQRLANPLMPYDSTTNPYITVDGLGVDVNVFNGAARGSEPDATGTPSPRDVVATVERGTNEVNLQRQRWLWKANIDGRYVASTASRPELVSATPSDLHFQSFNLVNSLGQLDQVYRFQQNLYPSVWTATTTFPWLNWNDRPFASHLELPMVPYGTAFGMLSTFDVWDNTRNPYDGERSSSLASVSLPETAGQFGHLFGFHADDFSVSTNNGIGANQGMGLPSLHRILDYVEVPSRFAGIEKYLNPAVFGVGGSGTALAQSLGMSAPNNSLSNYRYPGKINLNTLQSPNVYAALMGNYVAAVSFGVFNANRIDTTGTLPTSFPWVYRSADAANLVPSPALMMRSSGPTLFRRTVPNDTNPGGTALFDSNIATGPHNDPTRSAYFKYDMRQRMGNLVTNRSSVFAVWVTVGFFEIDPATGNPTQNEIGADDGSAQRYRGYFMVDRSIPVAFEPGKDHNVDRCVLTYTILDD